MREFVNIQQKMYFINIAVIVIRFHVDLPTGIIISEQKSANRIITRNVQLRYVAYIELYTNCVYFKNIYTHI